MWASRKPLVRRGIDLCARPAGEPGALERGAQRRAVVAVAGPVDLGLVELAHERAAAGEVAEVPLLVGEAHDVDVAPAKRGVGLERARDLDAVDHAERAIEPAGVVLGFAVRADHQPRPLARSAPDHVADAVDLGAPARPRPSAPRSSGARPCPRPNRSGGARRSGSGRTRPGAAGRPAVARHRSRAWLVSFAGGSAGSALPRPSP